MGNYILGIDASLTSTGYTIINENNEDVVVVDKIMTNSKENDDDRVFKIVNTLVEHIKKYEVKEVVMENSFVGKNAKTAMQLSRLRGAITYAVMDCDCTIIYYLPTVIRKILLGNGSADKLEVADFIREYYKDNELVQSLGEFTDKPGKKKNSDKYDAIATVLAHIKNKHEKTGE